MPHIAGWEWSSAGLAAIVDTAVTSASVAEMVATPVAEMRGTAMEGPSAAYLENDCCCAAEAARAAFVVVAADVVVVAEVVAAAAAAVVAAEPVDFAVYLDRTAARLEYEAVG